MPTPTANPPTLSDLTASPLFADHPEALVICTVPTAVIVAINQAAAELFEAAADAVHGKTLHQWLPASTVHELVSGGDNRLRRVVVEVRSPTGDLVTLEVSARPLQTATGVMAMLAVHDVTAHRLAEHELRLSHQRFLYLSQATSDAVWDWDIATGQIWWSDQYYGLFGLDASTETLTLEAWEQRVHPEDVQRVAGSLQQTVVGGGSHWQEHYRFLRGDGHYAHVLDRGLVLRGQDGQAHRMVGGLTDQTARLEAEAKVRESDARFRELVSHLDDAFWVLEVPPARLVYLSPAVEAITGISAEELVANPRRAAALLHPDDQSQVIEILSKPRAQFSLEYRILRGSEVRWLHTWATPVRDGNGNVCRVAGVTRDITEQKRKDEHLLRTQRLESIGTLAGGIAHDLNNILAPITLSAQLLSRQMPRANEDIRALLDVIEDAAKRGVGLVQQVLQFARGEDGVRVAVEPKLLFRDLRRIIRETFPKDIQARLTTQYNVWHVLGDATQLQQVLLNLAVNARDAMPTGGRLELVACNAVLQPHETTGLAGELPPGRYVHLMVRDSGFGMTSEQMARIFDPFYTTKPVGQGTGLGLPTALAIVRSHRGHLQVDSAPGQGTLFSLWLPAVEPVVHVPSPLRPATYGRGEGVLVVDDEEPIRQVLAAMLQVSGYRVWTARHGQDALQVLARARGEIAVVMTDLTMPVLDGRALIAALQRDYPDLPLIATSGMVEELPGGRSLPQGIHAFLPKPFEAEVLLQVLADVLTQARHATDWEDGHA